jgi:hypothetical protein
MGSFGFKYALVAAVVAASTACSIWAALDDPYKSEAASDAGSGSPDAGADVVSRVLDAGFVPYAIGSYGDTVYAVDDHASVHVAYEGGTDFSLFWTGDAGDLFDPATDGIAANASGVFWTVGRGVRYCASDGGACGFLPTMNPPKEIAASDFAVAWVDPMVGVRECTTPLSSCTNPLTFLAGKLAKNVAVAPDGTVAWAIGTSDIRFGGIGTVSLPAQAYFVAIDATTGELYWVGPAALGVVSFDGGVGPTTSLTSPTVTALFADHGVAYWSVNGYGIESCAFAPDAGCTSVKDVLTGVPMGRGNPQAREIVATSRNVFAVVTSDATLAPYPLLVVFPRSGR